MRLAPIGAFLRRTPLVNLSEKNSFHTPAAPELPQPAGTTTPTENQLDLIADVDSRDRDISIDSS